MPKNKGNREQRKFWGIGKIENQDFVLGEQGHFFEGNKGTGTQLGGQIVYILQPIQDGDDKTF